LEDKSLKANKPGNSSPELKTQGFSCRKLNKIFNRAKEITIEILKMRSMAFGAADFILSNSGKLYFIEINSAPGFTKLSESTYIKAFSTLANKSNKDIRKYCR